MNPRLPLLAALLCATLPAVQAQNLTHPDYVSGYQAWREARYPDASTHLSRFRLGELYARNYEVDYWLGTSWCRIEGRRPAGASLLDWAYRYGTMPETERGKFHGQLQVCLDSAAPAPPIIEIATAPRATSRIQAKVFFAAGQTDGGGLSAPPLRLEQPLPPAEYAARVFPTARLDQALAATRARLPAARVLADGRFVIASMSPQHGDAELRTIARRLTHFVAYLEREYAITMPDAVVTVYLVPDTRRLVELAATVHGIRAHGATLGYAFQNDLSVVGVLTGTAAGTLMHELFHLAVRARFGDIPQFLDEGMASLFETTFVQDGNYIAAPNWRGRVIRASRDMRLQVPLAEVITAPWFPDEPVQHPGLPRMDLERQAYVLSTARYFMAWLQLQGQLPAFFAAFRDRSLPETWTPADRQALDIVERATGMPVDELDRRFSQWLTAAVQVADGRPLPQPHVDAGNAPPAPAPDPRELLDRELPPR